MLLVDHRGEQRLIDANDVVDTSHWQHIDRWHQSYTGIPTTYSHTPKAEFANDLWRERIEIEKKEADKQSFVRMERSFERNRARAAGEPVEPLTEEEAATKKKQDEFAVKMERLMRNAAMML